MAHLIVTALENRSIPIPQEWKTTMHAENHPVSSKHVNPLCLLRAAQHYAELLSVNSQQQSKKKNKQTNKNPIATVVSKLVINIWRYLIWRARQDSSTSIGVFQFYRELWVRTKAHSIHKALKKYFQLTMEVLHETLA